MELITLYLWDELGVFAGSIQCDPFGPVPERATPTPPPGDAPAGQVWLWHGAWVAGAQPTPLPPPPDRPAAIPQISRAQGKAALITAGLWNDVLAYVAAIPDATQKALAEVALHDTQTWQRSSPFLAAAAQALGLSDEQLDELFATAALIEL